MYLKYDINNRTEPLLIYAAKTNGELLGTLSGIDPTSCNFNKAFNNQHELSFTVQKYIDADGQYVKSNFYDYVVKLNELFLENVGYFKIDDAPETVTDFQSYKEVTAYSLEKNLEQFDLNSFNINKGNSVSLEYLVTDESTDITFIATNNNAIINQRMLSYEYNTITKYESLLNEYTGTVWDYILFYNKADDYLQSIIDNYNSGISLSNDDIVELITLFPRIKYRLTYDINSNSTTYGKLLSSEIIVEEIDGVIVSVNGLYERIKELIPFYAKYKKQLSLIDLAIEKASTNWSIGDIDEELWNNRYQFEIDKQSIYSFLTQSLSSTAKCIFDFDIIQKKINTKKIDNIGKETSISIAYRNLQSQVQISCNSDNIHTRYRVLGGNDIDISEVNYGNFYIDDLGYYMSASDENGNLLYMSKELADKYKKYVAYRDSNRDTYVNFVKSINEANESINELIYRVPCDSLKVDYSTFTQVELAEEKISFQNMLTTLLTLFKNDYASELRSNHSGQLIFDSNNTSDMYLMKNSIYYLDYNAYICTLNEIDVAIECFPYYKYSDIENNKSAIFSNTTVAETEISLNKIKRILNEWQLNWDLYGLTELRDGLLEDYKNQANVFTEQGYDVPYAELSSDSLKDLNSISESEYNKSKYGVYLKFTSGQYNFYKSFQATANGNVFDSAYFEQSWLTSEFIQKFCLLEQTDGMINTYNSTYSPTWSDANENHIKDLWYRSGTVYVYTSMNTWRVCNINFPSAILSAIKNNNKIYTVEPTTFNKGDIYIKQIDTQNYADYLSRYNSLINSGYKIFNEYTFGDIGNLPSTSNYLGYIIQAKAAICQRIRDIQNYQNRVDIATASRRNITNLVTFNKNKTYIFNGESFSFNNNDFNTIRSLYSDSIYTNENILTTSLDDTISSLSVKKQLLEDAIEELSKESQPQYSFETTLDNLFGLVEFKPWHIDLDVGNFIQLETYKGQYVQLRVINIEFNPMMPESELTLTFSNMVSSKSKRNDFTNIFDIANGSTTANSGGGNNANQVGIDSAFSNTMLNKLLSSELFGTRITDVVLDTLTGQKGVFNTLNSKFAKFGGLANGTTTINGSCVNTGILKSNKVNSNGDSYTVINLNDGQFSFGNGVLSWDGSSLSIKNYATTGDLNDYATTGALKTVSDTAINAWGAITGLSTSLINGTTTINGGCITTGMIGANVIDVDALLAKGIIISGYITTNSSRIYYNQSTSGMTMNSSGIGGYYSSSQYWNMSAQGKLMASGVSISGEITATSGTLNNVTINNGTLSIRDSSGYVTGVIREYSSATGGLYMGTSGSGSLQIYGTRTTDIYGGISISLTSSDIKISGDTTHSGNISVSGESTLSGKIYTSKSVHVTDGCGLYNSNSGCWIVRKTDGSNWNNCCSLGNATYPTSIFANGNVYKNGSSSTYFQTTSTSDKRLKNYISDMDNYENFFMDLKPIAFKYHDGLYNHPSITPMTQWGFYAQDIIESFQNNGFNWKDEELVVIETGELTNEELKYVPDGIMLKMNYQNITALNTHMIQKTIRDNTEQDNLIANLQKQIYDLQFEIQKLKGENQC